MTRSSRFFIFPCNFSLNLFVGSVETPKKNTPEEVSSGTVCKEDTVCEDMMKTRACEDPIKSHSAKHITESTAGNTICLVKKFWNNICISLSLCLLYISTGKPLIKLTLLLIVINVELF